MEKISQFLLLFLIAFVLLKGCGEEDPPPPKEPTFCNCLSSETPMTVVISSAPKMAFIRISDNSYGANNFYMYELDSTANGFTYKGTEIPIETKIETENWKVPSGYLWAAGRAGRAGRLARRAWPQHP